MATCSTLEIPPCPLAGGWGSWTPPSVPVSPQCTCPVSSSELAPFFPAGFPLTVESSRTAGFDWRPLEVQECSLWIFPAAGRYQTLLQLTALPYAELSSGISERRSSPPPPSVPLRHGPGPLPEVPAADLPQRKARESAICNSHPFVCSSQVGTHHGLIQGEAFNILRRN